MLILHILIAISSLAVTTFTLFAPSQGRITTGKWLIGATLVSGIILAAGNHQQILHVCISGLAYSAAISVLTYAASRRFAASKTS